MNYLDILRGGLLGVTSDTLGAPVDLLTMGLRPLGYKVENPVMGSEWLAGKLGGAPNTGAGQAARIAGGLLSPDPMDAVKLAGLLGTINLGKQIKTDRYGNYFGRDILEDDNVIGWLGYKTKYVKSNENNNLLNRADILQIELNEDKRGNGIFNDVAKYLAKEHDGGIATEKFQTSEALKKAWRKLNGYYEDKNFFYYK